MARQITVKLHGGPLNGSTMSVPSDTEVINFPKRGVPLFTYTYSGKEKGKRCFAIKPKSRAAQRFVSRHVETTGTDPRVIAEYNKERPFVRPAGEKAMQKFQRGARKRADRRMLDAQGSD